MPYARNGGVRSWFEDWGGPNPAVLVYAGLGDTAQDAGAYPLVTALAREHRMILADHRGHGRSDAPHEESAYELRTRVGDVLAVLDAAGVDAAHLLGFSWGARLGFAVAEHAPSRLLSLIACGNQPFAWRRDWRFVGEVSAALEDAEAGGMAAFIARLQAPFGAELDATVRASLLEADPHALRAAWRSALTEGAISADLGSWRTPCLICMAEGEEMEDAAADAAAQIPGARLLRVSGRTHLTLYQDLEQILPAVRSFLAAAPG